MQNAMFQREVERRNVKREGLQVGEQRLGRRHAGPGGREGSRRNAPGLERGRSGTEEELAKIIRAG